jgi:hypothetical protein
MMTQHRQLWRRHAALLTPHLTLAHPLSLQYCILTRLSTSCFGIDEFFGYDLDGSLDSGLTGQLMPYGGIRHRVKDGATLWKPHVNRQSLVFNPAGVSRHAVVKGPSVKPARRRAQVSRCCAKCRVVRIIRLPPEHIRTRFARLRKVLRRGLISHQLKNSHSESVIHARRSIARTQVDCLLSSFVPVHSSTMQNTRACILFVRFEIRGHRDLSPRTAFR